MKVLDLQCTKAHRFEGWFASEGDYLEQSRRQLVECPICGDLKVSKLLSAPHLNFGARGEATEQVSEAVVQPDNDTSLQAAWLALGRRIVASTENVGSRFADEARKIHQGESADRPIRGEATREETQALLEEGIAVMPLPDVFKNTLQ